MTVDPTRNVVVFQLSRHSDEPAAADAPTRADDCVRQAWEIVRQQHQARADEVTALYSEWEPSAADVRFVQETFPTAEVMYSFRRPPPDGWDEAFAAARQTMARSARERETDEYDAAGHVASEGEILPILWSASSPRAELVHALPHDPVIGGQLYVALAWVAPTPRGTIGMSHLTYQAQQELGNPSFADLCDLAFDNVRTGLRIDVETSAHGDLLTVHRTGCLAAGAIALPDFHDRMAAIVGEDDLVVGLPCQTNILVAGAGSGWVEHIERTVLSGERPAEELVPAVLRLDRSGFRLAVERAEVRVVRPS